MDSNNAEALSNRANIKLLVCDYAGAIGARDEVGNPTVMLRGGDSMRQYFNYDPANRITKEAWRTSGGSDVYGFTYEYDAAANRARKTNLAGAHLYWNYDPADQLVIQKAGVDTRVYFEFDANGNTAVEHDVNASAGRTYYSYDPRNLLTLIDFPQSIATNYFYYNAVGERVRKDDSTGGKKYTWDGIVPIVEKNLSNSTVQRMLKGYTPIDGIGAYVMQDVSGTVIWPHKNQVGTTMRHTDGAEAVANTYEYDAWGQPLVTSQGTAQQYRQNSKELDVDFVDFNSVNRRYHYPVRAYVPFRGLFAQADPLIRVLPRSAAYRMASHSPSEQMDPTGLQDKKEGDECKMLCGPDVTDALKDVLKKVKLDFQGNTAAEVIAKCVALINPISALAAWEIPQLHTPVQNKWIDRYKPCGTPEPPCRNTVEVSGKCYHTGAVNYALFGVAMRLCDHSLELLASMVAIYKGSLTVFGYEVRAAAPNYQQSLDWATQAYNGWPEVGAPANDGPWKVCMPCGQKLGKIDEFSYIWKSGL